MTGVIESGMNLVLGICYAGKAEPVELPFSGYPFMETQSTITIDGLDIALKTNYQGSVYKIEICLKGQIFDPYYVYIKMCYKKGLAWSFNGSEDKRVILRQSPHDPSDHIIDIPKQAFPVAAVKNRNSYVALFSDNPATYDNYSTQELNHAGGYILVSSSDSGENVHEDGKIFKKNFFQEPKTFDFFITEFEADDLKTFRLNLFIESSGMFSSEKSLFFSLLFASNYMHYRKNETGYSDNWIVPGIDYSNKQYTRDAFWQSMILPLGMEQQTYDAVYPERYRYAENALIYIIWSFRLKQNGGNPNIDLLKDALVYIKENVTGGIYRAPRTKGKPSFRSWYDICAFEDDDIITYNQGLYAV
ncbi:MAG: hypothetical protein JW903_05170, partial [Clostridia bacterium]|nr:hypothetical protein [Clostridia bacterium]